jgi:hypothetical protein
VTTRTRWSGLLAAAALAGMLVAAGACLSSSPPAPPMRWFDPLSGAAEASARGGPPVDARVTAAQHLGREFLIRVGEHELAPDAQHAWIAEPRHLVAAALAQQLGAAGPDARRVTVDVEAFELDLREEPRAVVRLRMQDGPASHVVTARVRAPDRSPEALAAAMAGALAQACRDIAGILAGVVR